MMQLSLLDALNSINQNKMSYLGFWRTSDGLHQRKAASQRGGSELHCEKYGNGQNGSGGI